MHRIDSWYFGNIGIRIGGHGFKTRWLLLVVIEIDQLQNPGIGIQIYFFLRSVCIIKPDAAGDGRDKAFIAAGLITTDMEVIFSITHQRRNICKSKMPGVKGKLLPV